MKKTTYAVRKVVKAWHAGYSLGEIARREGLARATVRAWLKAANIDVAARASEAER